jgi:hypothetical protein
MSSIVVSGDTSGAITISAPAVAGTNTLTLPAVTDTLTGIAATQTLTNKTLTSPTLTTPALGTPASGILTSCTGVNYDGYKNRLINSAMVIDQRNAGASVTPTADSTYTLDRYITALSQSSKFSVQQNAGSVTPPAGFNNYLGVTSLSAYSVLAGDYFAIQQRIEGFNTLDLGWGAAGASTVTLSFWVRSSLTGTFGGCLANSAFNRSYPFSYTISSANTWEQKTITVAGDTSGTWLKTNGIGIRVSFALGYGATYGNGTAGAWVGSDLESVTGATSVVGTNGATFYITGVQLERGSTASSFEYRSYGTELALCQRYYEVLYNSADNAGIWGPYTTSYGYRGTWYFKVQKRIAASVSLAGSSAWTGATPSIFNGISSAAFFSSGTPFYSAGTADTLAVQASSEL